jgi:hypothetical protein
LLKDGSDVRLVERLANIQPGLYMAIIQTQRRFDLLRRSTASQADKLSQLPSLLLKRQVGSPSHLLGVLVCPDRRSDLVVKAGKIIKVGL